MQYGFDFQISKVSSTICKLYNYFNYSLDTQSPMLLVYITADRLLSFKHPTMAALLRKEKTQLAYFVVVIIWNLVWYSPIAFYYQLLDSTEASNSTDQASNLNTSYACDFVDLTRFLCH